MSLHRRAAKRDTVEAEIVQALQKVGARVWRLSVDSLPDLLCGIGGRFVLLECKSTRRIRRDQARQTAAIAELQARNLPVYVVRSVDDALQAVGALR